MSRIMFFIPLLLVSCLPASEDVKPSARAPLGMNLSGVRDWSTELVFVDAFKSARAWISQAPGQPWGKGGPLDLDARGHVRSLHHKQYAESVVWTDFKDQYPAGKYVCLYEGEGNLDFTGDARVVARKPGELSVEVSNRNGSAFCRITRTDPKNPIRNIRLFPTEALATYAEAPFRKEFLDRWKGFRVFRFMDWQQTNDSTLTTWDDRPTPDDHSQGIRGVALEHMIALCNTLQVEPWFCMPHRATDAFIRRFARLVREKLDPKLRVHVEYSNECWNGQFQQARYCAEQGQKLGLSKNRYEGQLRFYSQRSVEIFRLWEEEFAGRERLVRVLASQSANPWTGSTVLDWQDAHKQADAIAIAPYFGNRFGDPKTAAEVAEMSVEDLLKALEKDLAANRNILKTYATLARKRNLQLMAYEGGQHLAGYGGAENNEQLTRLFHQANRHPGMEKLYRLDLEQWHSAGGGLYCVFSSMGNYSKWGSWGVLEHRLQDPTRVPKMRALRDYLKE
ncbi:MAG: hypothetical protein U0840_07275 [Gemmataceae bacterium]